MRGAGQGRLDESAARGGALAKVVVITSGKGGVGKTTTAAAFAAGLALRGHKTVVIDFDVGLRNLDLIMGCERRVVFDFINVINGDANLNQALIKDKRNDNLFIFPTSQTRDKDALRREGVARVLEELKQQFDYIICDSPAGIEHGAITALYFANSARCASFSRSDGASSRFCSVERDASVQHSLSAAADQRRDRQGTAQNRPGPRTGRQPGAGFPAEIAERADRCGRPLCRDPRR